MTCGDGCDPLSFIALLALITFESAVPLIAGALTVVVAAMLFAVLVAAARDRRDD